VVPTPADTAFELHADYIARFDGPVECGVVSVQDGRIAAITPYGPTGNPAAVVVVPGLIDPHVDVSRSRDYGRTDDDGSLRGWLAGLDAELVAHGVTTAFLAVTLDDEHAPSGVGSRSAARGLLDLLGAVAATLRARYFVHLRIDVTGDSVDALAELNSLFDHPLVRLVSTMKHLPGCGQFADETSWRHRYQTVCGSRSAATARLARQRARLPLADHHRDTVLKAAQRAGCLTASHDDVTAADVDQLADRGVQISEFPVSINVARAARRRGMHTVLGAPNVLSGGSRHGNVSAEEAYRAGLLDILSSDYDPRSGLAAVHRLAGTWPGEQLFDESRWLAALKTATMCPAEVLCLPSGRLAPSAPADLVALRYYQGAPHVVATWRGGVLVYSSPFHDLAISRIPHTTHVGGNDQ
jgi:alpha-D-ribose 1-methylphosphonate 5-triphosphate diphosphatase